MMKQARLNRLFGPDGKCFDVAIDHGTPGFTLPSTWFFRRDLTARFVPEWQVAEAGPFLHRIVASGGSTNAVLHLLAVALIYLCSVHSRSGLDFLRWLRGRELDTRAIILSGRADKEMVMACLNEGASGYILKDMESDGLFRRALDTVFEGGIFLPANVIGRGGYSPALPAPPARIAPESLGITGRTLEVLYYVCQGLPNKSIARNMGIEEGTVRKDYLPKLFRIFHVVRRTELLVEVSRRGIAIPNPPQLEGTAR